MDGLHPRRVIHVRDRGQRRALELELLDTQQVLLFGRDVYPSCSRTGATISM